NAGDTRGKNETRVLLQGTAIRGQNLTSFQIEAAHIDAVVHDSLIYSGQAPAMRLASPPLKPAGGLQKLHCAATTICAQRSAFEVGRTADGPTAVAVSLLNCLVAAPVEATRPTLVSLAGWTLTQAYDDLGKLFSWKSTTSAYLGWKTLVGTQPEEK